MVDCRDAETLIQIRGDNVCWIDGMVIEFKRRASEAWHHLRSGGKDLQKALEREIINEIYGNSNIVANIDSEFLSSLYGFGTVGRVWHALIYLLLRNSFTLHAFGGGG